VILQQALHRIRWQDVFPRPVRICLGCGFVALAVFYLLLAGFFNDVVYYPSLGFVAAAVCNTASRIQELTKGTRHMLLFSNATLSGVVHPPDDLVDVGDTEIRGRQAAAKLWSLESISDSE